MKEESRPPLDTKEFVAGWQSIVEEHVGGELAGAVRKLASGDPEALTRHLTHAFSLAAGSTGNVTAAIQYLCEAALQAEQPKST
ncbi:MAG TPA: hypothetical protein VH680_00205 [Gemmatimonadales bacterium]|jgi:hypothetical protein